MNADLPVLEVQGGVAGWSVGSRQMSAYRSLAQSRNVPIEQVLDAATENRLVDIIELRDFGKQRKVEERNLNRIRHCYRLQLLGILQERYDLLRQRGL